MTLESTRPMPLEATRPAELRPARLWTGRVVTGLVALFLFMDFAMKLALHPAAVEGTTELGYPEHAVLTIGVLGLLCWVLYLVPRTAVLGAILYTGYLGGAVATHVRLDAPLFSHTLFPVYVGALLWLGLFLRETRLGELLPLRKAASE